jgi:hypothetical protein
LTDIRRVVEVELGRWTDGRKEKGIGREDDELDIYG